MLGTYTCTHSVDVFEFVRCPITHSSRTQQRCRNNIAARASTHTIHTQPAPIAHTHTRVSSTYASHAHHHTQQVHLILTLIFVSHARRSHHAPSCPRTRACGSVVGMLFLSRLSCFSSHGKAAQRASLAAVARSHACMQCAGSLSSH